jgi:3-methyladenine DNA glycosylase/8-oxoguanine DNA glycosylase
MTPTKALKHLRAVDPALARVIARVGPYRLVPDVRRSHFAALARSIIYQQLSTKAATTIHGRVVTALGPGGMRAANVLAASDEVLRGAGLSAQKISYLRDLAARVADGRLPTAKLARLDDAEVTRVLVEVKGIGEWTAQMYLMFRLGRPDVLPTGDLGIQIAVQKVYGLRARATPTDVARIGATWAPYRSVATWYLWRSLEE